jgi:hypothetical protein
VKREAGGLCWDGYEPNSASPACKKEKTQHVNMSKQDNPPANCLHLLHEVQMTRAYLWWLPSKTNLTVGWHSYSLLCKSFLGKYLNKKKHMNTIFYLSKVVMLNECMFECLSVCIMKGAHFRWINLPGAYGTNVQYPPPPPLSKKGKILSGLLYNQEWKPIWWWLHSQSGPYDITAS